MRYCADNARRARQELKYAANVQNDAERLPNVDPMKMCASSDILTPIGTPLCETDVDGDFIVDHENGEIGNTGQVYKNSNLLRLCSDEIFMKEALQSCTQMQQNRIVNVFSKFNQSGNERSSRKQDRRKSIEHYHQRGRKGKRKPFAVDTYTSVAKGEYTTGEPVTLRIFFILPLRSSSYFATMC